MPFHFHELTSDNGMLYLRLESSDHVGLADGKALEAQLLQPHLLGGRVLSVVSKGADFSPEVRKFFPTLRDKFSKLAVVVNSPIGRAAINMMLRLTYFGEGGIIRMFTSEHEAMEWLESDKP